MHLSYNFFVYVRYSLVLDKTVKGIRVLRFNNQKLFCAPGLRTKHFERIFFRSIDYILD